MFKIKWDKKNNGIILSDRIDDKNKIIPPRFVFYEELDLLGFDKYWNYPKSEKPLLWAIGRRYFYRGVVVAEANGGNIYEKPILKIIHKRNLEPIDIDLIIQNNLKFLKILEGEAIDFIQDIHKKYKKKELNFAVAFSGGKDSQVVLDLVSRVIAPQNYETIYTDTGMEIPFTQKTINYTINRYSVLYPEFKFHTAKADKDILFLWNKFGTPSRIHRWCCSVSKTIPFAKKIKQIFNNNDKYVVFEGVRAEESSKRSKYSRVTINSKKTKQINAEIILDWNVTEVFLYLFYRNIIFNDGYRFGLTRVGCSICPFSSPWSEFIMQKLSSETTEKFVSIIREQAKIESKSELIINDFVKNGQWKVRSGGRNIDVESSINQIKRKNNQISFIIENQQTDLLEWLKVLGEIRYIENSQFVKGEINASGVNLVFEIENKEKKQIVTFYFQDNKLLENRIKKIINKTAFCIQCNACEVECPVGAISFKNGLKINSNLCINCLKCLSFSEKGCLRAKSINVTEGGSKMSNNKIATSKYQTFGLRNHWLKSFLNKHENWFNENPAGLGNRQLQAMNSWLRDAEVINSKKEITPFGNVLLKYKRNENRIWLLIWTNLFYKVNLIKWYSLDIKWGEHYTTKELVELIVSKDDLNKPKTTQNAISSLVNMFAESPLSSELAIGKITKKSNTRTIWKTGSDEIDIVSIAYSLYKYAEAKERYKFTVSEFFSESCDGGPRILFGLSKENFEKSLRNLQEGKNQLVRVNLNAGLDNIFFREDVSSLEVLELLSE